MKQKLRKEIGITLVALIVTIVVLLILAGITIMYTMGDNSIFKKAQEAKDKTNQAIKNEQEYMNSIDNMLNEYLNGTINGGTSTPTDVSIENIKSDWETIEKIAQEIAKDDTITSETEEVKVVIDGKRYTIKPGDIFEVEYNGEVRRVRVLGFKHDDLVDKTAYGGTNEKASISFEFLDFMTGDTYMSMNSSDTNENGWAATEMRTFLEGTDGRGKLSNNSYLKQVKKKYIKIYNDASSVTTCNDYLWILAASEVVSSGYQSGAYANAIISEGNQYKYYQGVTEEWNSPSTKRIKKTNSSGSEYYWWLRSPGYSGNSNFCGVNIDGDVNNRSWTSRSYGVAPGFCI